MELAHALLTMAGTELTHTQLTMAGTKLAHTHLAAELTPRTARRGAYPTHSSRSTRTVWKPAEAF